MPGLILNKGTKISAMPLTVEPSSSTFRHHIPEDPSPHLKWALYLHPSVDNFWFSTVIPA
jgi:hypothetical protein